MKKLNKTEYLIFILLCVLSFQRQPFRFFILPSIYSLLNLSLKQSDKMESSAESDQHGPVVQNLTKLLANMTLKFLS